MSDTQHQLQWRGRSVGPWTLVQIREALDVGEIHSLYRICISGEWLTLRDYLEQVDAVELERRAVSLGTSLRQKDVDRPREQAPLPGKRTMGFESQVSRPNPFGKPPPVFVKGASGPVQGALHEIPDDLPTCWLAVAAFVVSCACFVPYLNLVSWLPGLVLGHLALKQLDQQPMLEGRGLALGALIISYATTAFAVITVLFFPDLFYRVFPIGDA
jgi:hypothetical protein